MKTPPTAEVEAPVRENALRTQTMKAIVKAQAGSGAEIREVPVPGCPPGGLLLRVLRAGVCGTDLHI
jgi:D-arabinose 1-dehydrogenase-like Zn-dependent alcohol dehydrogenase